MSHPARYALCYPANGHEKARRDCSGRARKRKASAMAGLGYLTSFGLVRRGLGFFTIFGLGGIRSTITPAFQQCGQMPCSITLPGLVRPPTTMSPLRMAMVSRPPHREHCTIPSGRAMSLIRSTRAVLLSSDRAGGTKVRDIDIRFAETRLLLCFAITCCNRNKRLKQAHIVIQQFGHNATPLEVLVTLIACICISPEAHSFK